MPGTASSRATASSHDVPGSEAEMTHSKPFGQVSALVLGVVLVAAFVLI